MHFKISGKYEYTSFDSFQRLNIIGRNQVAKKIGISHRYNLNYGVACDRVESVAQMTLDNLKEM